MKYGKTIYAIVIGLCLAAALPAQARSLSDIDSEFASARGRMYSHFIRTGQPFRPERIALITLKAERRVELWASYCAWPCTPKWQLIKHYPIKAASGLIGPKLKRGDKQVPEGIYTLEYLNPNSRFHLSFKINYPNKWDRLQGQKDRRRDLGDNIFFHGKALSIGCVAVGDRAIEELFTLIHRIGLENVKVIIAPYDFRIAKARALPWQPKWVPELYQKIHLALVPFKPPTRAKR